MLNIPNKGWYLGWRGELKKNKKKKHTCGAMNWRRPGELIPADKRSHFVLHDLSGRRCLQNVCYKLLLLQSYC